MFDTAPPQHQGGESGSSGVTPPRIPLDQRLVQEPLAKGKRPLRMEDEVKSSRTNAPTMKMDLVSKEKARACPNAFQDTGNHSSPSTGALTRIPSMIYKRNFLCLKKVFQFLWLIWKTFWGQLLPRTTSLVPLLSSKPSGTRTSTFNISPMKCGTPRTLTIIPT